MWLPKGSRNTSVLGRARTTDEGMSRRLLATVVAFGMAASGLAWPSGGPWLCGRRRKC
jgi:hypothetical protein